VTRRQVCPACGVGELELVLSLPSVPVLSTVFYRNVEDARRAPRGDLELTLCRNCALVWNVAFDPALVDYTPEYENSLHFSPTFQQYAEGLAQRLTNTYDLAGKIVVEVGTGKGEFLSLLCEMANCQGIGFDPTFAGEISDPRVHVVRGYFDEESAIGLQPALVVVRHVLEHVDDPVGLVRSVRRATRSMTPVYYEVPNAEMVFSDEGMWDLIYQHVGYFGPAALAAVFQRGGYEVTRLEAAFHGQFLSLEAVPGVTASGPDSAGVGEACAQIETFADRLVARLAQWRDRLSDQASGDVVVWGAGAKGVSFLNLLAHSEAVDLVVDLNPRKVGRYVPGTGHRIDSPESLRNRCVEAVLLPNRSYHREIREELARMGSHADIVPL
jgi:hypothetical protein